MMKKINFWEDLFSKQFKNVLISYRLSKFFGAIEIKISEIFLFEEEIKYSSLCVRAHTVE
jgi:hypothetical protein